MSASTSNHESYRRLHPMIDKKASITASTVPESQIRKHARITASTLWNSIVYPNATVTHCEMIDTSDVGEMAKLTEARTYHTKIGNKSQ